MDIKTAASLLEKELRSPPWLTMVGVGEHEGREAIFLYVKSPQAVPAWITKEGWQRYPVIVRKMGSPRPVIKNQ
jgi:hypothetical protein